jgi:septal ring factor EnvC (AmiA/AmiB activator)
MPSEPDARAGACDAALWRRRFEEACERLESKHLSLVELEAGLNQARTTADVLRAELDDMRRRLGEERSRHAEAIASLAEVEARLNDSGHQTEAAEVQLMAARAESAALNEQLSEINPIMLARVKRLTHLAERLPRVAAACATAWRTADALARVIRRSRSAWTRRRSTPSDSFHLRVLIGPAASDNPPLPLARGIDEPVAAGSKEP